MKGAVNLWLIGGEDIHFRRPLAQVLVRRGFRVTLLGSCRPEQCGAGELFEHRHYVLDRRFRPFSDIRTVAQLRSSIREGRPHLIHAFDTKPGVLAPIAARGLSGTAVVRTITGLGAVFGLQGVSGRFFRGAYWMAQRLAAPYCDMTIFQNRDDMAQFIDKGVVDRAQCRTVLGSGIDVESLESAAGRAVPAQLRAELRIGGESVVLMASRIVGQKGVREFIEAAGLLQSSGEKIAFLLAGPLETNTIDGIPQREIESSGSLVRYLGPRSDVPALLAMTDVAVLPTYYREGAPRFIMEAQALGVPVVTCDVPGSREVVDAGTTGILVKPRDAKQLAEAVRQLIRDPSLRAGMGAAGRRRVLEKMSLDAVADQYISCYEALLSNRSGAINE